MTDLFFTEEEFYRIWRENETYEMACFDANKILAQKIAEKGKRVCEKCKCELSDQCSECDEKDIINAYNESTKKLGW